MKTIAAARGDDSKFGLIKKEAIEYDVLFYRLRLFGHFLKTKASLAAKTWIRSGLLTLPKRSLGSPLKSLTFLPFS
ncbi:hypothetical protein ABE871_05515 [Enterococcus gilvus]|uniref:hypothetical protein n=1 Tax=Enterococcus gilvus TaxID=160453 RepID=UPI003D6C4FFC